MNKPGTKPDPNKVYKRDNAGKFAKVNSLLKKIAMAKAQGVPHVPPGKTNKVPLPFSALKNMAAKKLGHDLYMRKKAGEFSNDHSIYLEAAKLANQYKKTHPSASTGMSANQIVNAYKRHEYDEVGYVTLLGQISGNLNQLKRDGAGSDWTPSGKSSAPSKPTIDKTKTGMSITSDKFSKPDTLKPTGKTLGGVTGAKVYTDGKGQQWVVKTPKTGSNAYGNKSFMVDVEIAASRIQNKAGLPVPAMHEEEVDGKHSAVSKMYVGPNGGPVTEAFPKGKGLDIATMSPEDILEIQKNQFLDWLMSNHDSHSANFLRTEDGIVGIDKGQSFKFFGKDKLSYNYEPVTPLDGNVPVYQRIWKQFAQGKGELFDPNGPELKATIERIQNIPDAEFKKLLRPYATKAAASGSLSMPNKPAGAGKAELVNHFLDEVTKRKNNLSKDFGAYYDLVKSEHDKNKPPPMPNYKPVTEKPDPVYAAKQAGKSINDKYTPVEQFNKGILSVQQLKDMSSPVGAYEDLQVGDKLLQMYDDGTVDDIIEITAIAKPNATGPNKGAKYKSLLGGYGGSLYPNFFTGSNGDNTYKIPESGSKPPGSGRGNYSVGDNIAGITTLAVGDKFEAVNGSIFTVEKIGDGYKYIEVSQKGMTVNDVFYPSSFDPATAIPYIYKGNANAPSNKPVGAQLFPDDIKPGMFVSMVVMGTAQKPFKLGALMHVAKIVGDDVYMTNQDGKAIDVKLDFFTAGNFVVAAPEGNAKAPELNKPIKSLAGLKLGDKIQSGYAVDFTITGFGADGNGKYATAVDGKGAYAGNFYEDSFANQIKGNEWIYVGNINDQGSVTATDLAGQTIDNIQNVIGGDKINYKDTDLVATGGGGPGYIYAKKVKTNAVVKITAESFKNGEVTFSYTSKATRQPDAFEPIIGGQPKYLDIGQEVLVTGDEGSALPVKVNIANIDEDGNGNIQSILVISPAGDEQWEYVPVKGNDGKVHWVDDPTSFLNDDVGLFSELGLPAGSQPKGKVKIEGELAKDVKNVDLGDVILSQSSTSDAYFKVIKLNAGYNGTAIEAINMDDGTTELVFDYEFDKGYVTWGDQNAKSASGINVAPPQVWQTYPADDLYTGPLLAKNVPGTTLQNKTLLPGWGVYKGYLTQGDEVVGYGPNGEFKKGEVIQNAGGTHNVYVKWDDDDDWVEFTKTSSTGFWGDGSMNGVDSYTLIGKVQSATGAGNPPPQMPMGPHPATQASSIPTITSPNKGKAATFDNLSIGMVYHVPNGKMQKVIIKDADSFTAQSVSGNTHTYPKEKFNTWASDKGVLLGMPGDSDPAPSLAEVTKDNIYIVPKDPFDPSGSQTKYVVKSKTAKTVVLRDVSTGGEKTVQSSDWDAEAKGWKHVPGMSDWEKYSQGLITWEEYQETNGHKETAKLHTPEGPAAPGKASPAESFGVKKVRKEMKPPPPWSAIKGDPVVVKELGAQIWEMKKTGDFGGDEMMLWKACEKVRRMYVKANPTATDVPSKNQIRHAARRFEYEETGAVVWETAEQQTAQVVGNIQTAKGAINHKPTGKYTYMQDKNKMPLTAFGDSKKLAGSYQNPINFGYHTYTPSTEMSLFGSTITPQTSGHYTTSERSTITHYTGGGYNGINGYLRSGVKQGSSAGYAQKVKDMDSAMKKANAAEDWYICTRGAGGGYDFGLPKASATLEEVRAQIGKTVENKGYSSTSLGSKPAFGGNYRIIYRVPPGLKALWVSGDGKGHTLSSQGSGEREVILPRNLKVRVIAAEEHTEGMGYKHDVIVEIVGWEGQGK